jgi:hypothetical protein
MILSNNPNIGLVLDFMKLQRIEGKGTKTENKEQWQALFLNKKKYCQL